MVMPDDQIHSWLASQGLHSGLSVTAGHGDEGVWRMATRLPDQVPRRPLGVPSDRAGVEDQEVGGFPESYQTIALLSKAFTEDGRFGVVETASQRMDRSPLTKHGRAL